MLPTKDNFYHPFTKSFVGFGVYVEHSKENDSLFDIEDIDLYYQPVEQPVTGIIYLVLTMIAVVVAEFVQVKVFCLAKGEDGLVKEVTQIYSLTKMILMPVLFVTTIGTDFMHPLNEIIGQWFCTVIRFLTYLHLYVTIIHSFVVAMMRYIFIVQGERVKKFGKEKTKRLFAFASLFIPLIMVTWGCIENAELDPILYINRCYGIDHKVFLVDISALEVHDPFFCKFENNNYESGYGKFLYVLRKTTCITKTFLTLFMALNFTEGVLYYKIFSHMKRYVVCI